MTELTLALIGKGKSEKFSKAEVRMGRDPSCDFVLQSEEFPMVGRQHAILRFHDGVWSVEDLQSTNGTFVNQKKIQRQQLSPGDTLRLGSDGPEIRVQFVDQSSAAVTRPAALAAAAAVTQPSVARGLSEPPPTGPAAFGAATPAMAPAEPGPTRVGEPPPTRPVAIGAAPAVAHMQAGPAQPREPAPTRLAPEPQHRAPEPQQPGSGSSVQASDPEQPEQISEEEDPMNEERLKLLRNLVMLMVALVLVLGGIVISQMQQISDIRQSLKDMRTEARTAVGKFQPELDERMTKMETTMNGMDEKIQKAEDRFVVRMEKELPVIMDREVEKQTKKIIREVETGNIPH